jgi:O-antigen/teichoic acid export membrane protein
MGVVTFRGNARLARFGVTRGAVIVVDQVASSLTTLTLLIVAGRESGPAGLGAVSLALAMAIAVVALARAVAGETALVYGFGDSSGPLSAAIATVAVAMPVVCATALLLRGDVRQAMLAILLLLPIIVAQDVGRYWAFAAKRPALALASDSIWLCTQLALLLLIARGTDGGPATLLLAWGAGAAAGLLVLVPVWRPRVEARPSWKWIRQTRALSGWLGAQVLFAQGAGQLTLVAIAAAAGLGALGGVRAAQALVSPLALVLASLPPLVLPHLASHEDAEVIRRSATWISAGAGAAAAVYATALVAVGSAAMAPIFGDPFRDFGDLVYPFAVIAIAQGAAVGPGIGSRAIAAGRAVFSTQLAATALGLPAILVLSTIWGASGAAWGLAFQAVVLALAAHVTFRLAQRARLR